MPERGVRRQKADYRKRIVRRGSIPLSPPNEASVGDMIDHLITYMDKTMDNIDPEVRKRLNTILDKLHNIASPAAQSPNPEVRELGKMLQVNF